jgi:hypothetical protein|tara:strand:- start:55 stop:291 length:237 start_codon:yes stop_codon:yes gene_type:complete
MDENLERLIEKILGYKTWSDKKKIDALLEYDCNMYTNLGIDSTKTQVENVKRNSRAIYRAISKVNPKVGKDFLWHMDK